MIAIFSREIYGQTPDTQRANTQQELFRVSKVARSAETSGDFERALELWRVVDSLQPGYYSAYQGIKRSLIGLERYDEALAFLDKSLEYSRTGNVQLDPVSIAADRIEIIFAAEDEEAGLSAVEDILKRFQGNSKIYKDISNILAGQRLSEEAIDVLIRGRKECGDPYMFARDLARWYEARMDWESAIDEYLLLLKSSPGNMTFVTGAFGDMSAEPHIDSLVVRVLLSRLPDKDKSFQITLRRLLASLHFRAQRYSDALEQYQIMERESGGQGKELLEFANLTSAEGKYRLAAQAYDEILAGDPKGELKAVALIGKGTASMALGEIDTAETAFREVLKPGVPPASAFDAYSLLGQLNFDHYRKVVEARDLFEKGLQLGEKAKLPPDRIDILRIKIALTYEFEGDFDLAEKTLSEIVKKSRNPRGTGSTARFELAKLDFRRGKFEKAAESASMLINTDPSSPEANDALNLKVLINDLQDNPEIIKIFGITDLMLFRGKPDSARSILVSLKANASARVQEESLWRLIEIEKSYGSSEQTLELLTDIIKIKSSLRKDLALFMAGNILAHDLGNTKDSIAYFEQLLIEFPDSPLVDRARRQLTFFSKEVL